MPSNWRYIQYTAPGPFEFTVPDNVSCLLVTMVGAGGGGAGESLSHLVSQAGASGEQCIGVPLHVTPGETIAGIVGTGGAAGLLSGTGGQNAQNGTATSFGPFFALGGAGGRGTGSGTQFGGGVAGGQTGGALNHLVVLETISWNGGFGGGQRNVSIWNSPVGHGGKGAGNWGGVFGTEATYQGGAGGAATTFAPGGDGGSGVSAFTLDAKGSPGAYGSGGGAAAGGAGTVVNEIVGGRGGDGYVMILWFGPE